MVESLEEENAKNLQLFEKAKFHQKQQNKFLLSRK